MLLLRLQDFRAPYVLRIRSDVQRRSEIFMPSGLYLDENYEQVGEFGETRLSGNDDITAELPIDASMKNIRYVLLFTRGQDVGLSLPRERSQGYYWVERSLSAKLEVSTKAWKQ